MADETDCSLCALPQSEWLLSFLGTDLVEESAREALLTLANGYFATRGAAPEAISDGRHYPATYVAGLYNRLCSSVDGVERWDESLVNIPNWLPFTIRIDQGPWFDPYAWTADHHHVVLDLRRGVMFRELEVLDPAGRRTRIRQQRFVSMDRPHLAYLRVTILPENWSGSMHIRTRLDGHVRNDNVAEFGALAKQHLTAPVTGQAEDLCWLATETNQSQIRIALASLTKIYHDGSAAQASGPRAVPASGGVCSEWTVTADPKTPVTADKIVAIYTSRDHAISEPLDAAKSEVVNAASFRSLLDAHVLAWEHLWQRFHLSVNIQIPAGGQHSEEMDAQRSINVHLFHLAQTLSRHTADLDAGVPARGLHGEGYRGHVFWDELFVFPLLNLRMPELTRALLMYRYRRLPQARKLARQNGAAGALFPWQSGSDGREETPSSFFNSRSGRWIVDNSHRQFHVNLAIGYNVWQYYQVTSDIDFLASYGAELLIEIARFWTAIAEYDQVADRYHLRHMMGPDEFHDGYPDQPGIGVDDNAYVAVMTSWLLATVLDVYEVLGRYHSEELWQRLAVTQAELRRWDHVSRRLYVPYLADGLLAQFEGYDELAELDLNAYIDRYGDIGRLDLLLESESDTTNRYKVSKQADVLMLFYLFSADELAKNFWRLGYEFDPGSIPLTIEYYLARTTHGSTLSRVAHAWVLSRRDRAASWKLLCEALAADFPHAWGGGTTGHGIHLGAMAATSDILQRCFTDLETRGNSLRLHPRLPDALNGLNFDLRYRGHWLSFQLTHELLEIRAKAGAAAPIAIFVNDVEHVVRSGGTLRVWLKTQPVRVAK